MSLLSVFTKGLAGTEILPVAGSDNRADVSSRNASRKYYASRDKGNVFSWRSSFYASANSYCLYLRNDSLDESIFLDEVHVRSDQKVDFQVLFVTGASPSGNAVIPVNWNCQSQNCGHDNSTSLSGGVLGVSDGGIIIDIDVVEFVRESYKFEDAVILGNGDAIAIKVDAAANVHINLIGVFE